MKIVVVVMHLCSGGDLDLCLIFFGMDFSVPKEGELCVEVVFCLWPYYEFLLRKEKKKGRDFFIAKTLLHLRGFGVLSLWLSFDFGACFVLDYVCGRVSSPFMRRFMFILLHGGGSIDV